MSTATLLLALPHESGLVGSLVGVGAGHGSEDLVQTLGCHLEDTGAQDLGPVIGREVAQSGAVDQSVDDRIALHGLDEMRVVVAHGDRGNLGVAIIESLIVSPCIPACCEWSSGGEGVDRYLHIEQHVSVRVCDVVANGGLVVGEHVQAPGVKDLVQVGGLLLGLGARDLRLDGGSVGLDAIEATHVAGGDGERSARDWRKSRNRQESGRVYGRHAP